MLRLVIFYSTKRKMILHPTHFIRNVDPVSLNIAQDEKYELTSIDPRTGTALSATYDSSQINSDQNNNCGGWAHLSELLWIVRPFIYGK